MITPSGGDEYQKLALQKKKKKFLFYEYSP
jgi:hypothetical protein